MGLFLPLLLAAGTAWSWNSQLLLPDGGGFTRAVVERDSLDFRLADFSFAGYRAGEDSLPNRKPDITLSPETGDNVKRINDAIRKLAKLPTDSRGIRGKLLLKAGTWEIGDEIRIFHSGIILAGEGADKTFLYVNSRKFARKAAISVSGPSSEEWKRIPAGTHRAKMLEDPPDQATFVRVETADTFKPGQMVIVRQWPSREFSRAHGADGIKFWPASLDNTAIKFARMIRDVRGDTLLFTEPLRYPLHVRYGAHVFPAAFLQEVGIENFSIGFAKGDGVGGMASTNRAAAIYMNDVMNGWVRGVKSYQRDENSAHLQSYGITLRACKWITVQDCSMQDPQNKGVGGNGYLYNPVTSDAILFRRCRASGGRHNFALHYSSSGCVITDSYSAYSRSDFHQFLSTENLFDNFTLEGDSLTAGNRGDKSQGAWWTTAKATLWNLKGSGAVYLNSWHRGYLIGVAPGIRVGTGTQNILQDYGDTYLPELQWVEPGPEGEALDPPSLYEFQLKERLSSGTRVFQTDALVERENATRNLEPQDRLNMEDHSQ